jgi:hypothetical protein
MKELFDPKDYYQPGKLRLDSEVLELAQDYGMELATLLAAGDVTPLPDAVDSFLIKHTCGINNRRTGEARVAIAQQLQNPPFTPEDARQIGELVGALVVTTQEAATKLSLGDTMGAIIFGIGLPETDPPKSPEAL